MAPPRLVGRPNRVPIDHRICRLAGAAHTPSVAGPSAGRQWRGVDGPGQSRLVTGARRPGKNAARPIGRDRKTAAPLAQAACGVRASVRLCVRWKGSISSHLLLFRDHLLARGKSNLSLGQSLAGSLADPAAKSAGGPLNRRSLGAWRLAGSKKCVGQPRTRSAASDCAPALELAGHLKILSAILIFSLCRFQPASCPSCATGPLIRSVSGSAH